MSIKFPAECITEAQRLSFSFKLDEVLRLWHNVQCAGMSPTEAREFFQNIFFPKSSAVHKEKNDNIAEAKLGTFWFPDPDIHWIGDKVVYPGELDQANEGSRLSFLYGLEEKLREQGIADMDDLHDKLAEARADAISGTFWAPTMGDIQ